MLSTIFRSFSAIELKFILMQFKCNEQKKICTSIDELNVSKNLSSLKNTFEIWIQIPTDFNRCNRIIITNIPIISIQSIDIFNDRVGRNSSMKRKPKHWIQQLPTYRIQLYKRKRAVASSQSNQPIT